MVGEREILQSYLADALRLAGEARECVAQLAEQKAQLGRVSPGQVQALLRVVHTLKGTSTMVRGGEPVVEALHTLEGRLVARPLIDLAARPDWSEEAARCVERVQEALADLQARERISVAKDQEAPPPAIDRGLLLRVAWERGSEPALHWFPIGSVARALPTEAVRGLSEFLWEGRNAPVLGLEGGETGSAPVVLALETLSGTVLLRAIEVAGWIGWPEAEKLGASRGLEALAA